jgi:hypothetical protein
VGHKKHEKAQKKALRFSCAFCGQSLRNSVPVFGNPLRVPIKAETKFSLFPLGAGR